MKLFRKKKKKDVDASRQRPVNTANQPRQPVFSYYASQRQAQPRASATPMRQREEIREPSEGFSWKKIPTIIAVVIIIVCMFIASTLSSNPKVHVRVADTGEAAALYRPMSDYQTAAEEALASSAFNKSKFTVQREAIASYIMMHLSEVTEVRLSTPLVSRDLVVSIDTTTPALIIQSPTGSFVVDDTGTVITTLKQAPAVAGKDLPVVTDQADPQINIGKPLLAAQEVEYIRSLYKELVALNMAPASMTMPNGIANELHIKFKDQPYYVKFALNGDPRLQAGTYMALKENLAKQGTVPGEYVDVRVEGRAYYR